MLALLVPMRQVLMEKMSLYYHKTNFLVDSVARKTMPSLRSAHISQLLYVPLLEVGFQLHPRGGRQCAAGCCYAQS